MSSILITGGTGSFGRAYVDHLLLNTKTERIIVLSRGEHAQAAMAQHITERPEIYGDNAIDRLRFFIGDIRDAGRLRRAFAGASIVVHAAALKRIEVGHYNPDEMVKTNVIGTMNVIEAAQEAGVRRVVGISSDKAWQPVSAYGQSKALAETLMLSANNMRGPNGTQFLVVRYGNVAGSAGSVIPKWREKLKSSDAVDLTDPECTRFWMFMDAAVRLVHDAATLPKNSDSVIVPTLPAYRLHDLAVAMGAKTINVKGLPSWEKKHEGMCDGKTSDKARRLSVDELKTFLPLV